MSASARSAPARLVRRKYRYAHCCVMPASPHGEWIVWNGTDEIGRGRTRGAAWRSAAFRVKTGRD